MPKFRLLSTEKLTIQRRQAGGGYFDDNYQYIEPTPELIEIDCSVQPFRNGQSQIELPEGVRSSDARNVYTKTPILTNIEQQDQLPDITTIDGFEYECFNVENWSRYGLKVDHYRAVFIRKDKLSGVQ